MSCAKRSRLSPPHVGEQVSYTHGGQLFKFLHFDHTENLPDIFPPVFRPPMDLQRDIDTSTPLMYRRVGVTAMSEIEVRSPRVEHHIENQSAIHRNLDNTVMSEAETRPPTSFGGPTSTRQVRVIGQQSLTAQKRTPRALTTHSFRVTTPEPQSKRRKRRIRGKDSQGVK